MTWTEGIEDMIDSYSDKIDSLADIEEYQLMAEELAVLDVFHAYFSMNTNSYSDMTDWLEQAEDIFPIRPEQQQRIEESINDTALLKPYQAFATGAGLDEYGYFLAIVLLVLTAGLGSGCSFSVGHQTLMVRPGNAVPARAFENGDGEVVVLEGMAPKGDTLFIFIGGRFQESSERTSRAAIASAVEINETKEIK